MKKKSLITMLTALTLAGVVLVGATLAYLTSNDTAVNTFTVGNVNIDLIEPDWNPEEGDGQNLEPGATVDKNPMIVNTGKNEGYMLMHIDGMAEMAAAGFSAVYDATNWTYVDENGNELPVPANNALVDGYYAYNFVVAAGEKTAPLFEQVVYSKDAVQDDTHVIEAVLNEETGEITGYTYKIGEETKTAATYEEAEAALLEAYGASYGVSFDLTVTGYAIQTTGFEETGMAGWVPALITATANEAE